jgi:hypothetical protein
MMTELMKYQQMKPKKIHSHSFCHKKEWKQQKVDNTLLWAYIHLFGNHGSNCKNFHALV